MNRTLIIFENISDDVTFYVYEGENIDRFHNQNMNSGQDDLIEEEMLKFFYEKDGNFKLSMYNNNEVIHAEKFDSIIFCGFIQ